MKKVIYLFIIIFITTSCTEDADDVVVDFLEPSSYITPQNDSVCQGLLIQGVSGIEVFFSWENFNTNQVGISYEIVLTNLVTNNTQTITALGGNTFVSTVLDFNTTYEWFVTATSESGLTAIGDTYQFKTPYEAVVNSAPFPAVLNMPASQEVVPVGNVTFNWTGSDPDIGETDTLTYNLYLSTANPPSIHTTDINLMSTTVNLSQGNYYWYVKSIDVIGNASYSSIRNFTVQ